MIPTMIVFGLLFGRWWKTAVILGALVWPSLLLTDSAISGSARDILGAALFGLANTAAGVGVHQAVLRAVRRFRLTNGPAPTCT